MSDNFTYQAPDSEKYLQLLLKILKEEETLLYSLLKDSKCVINPSNRYSRTRKNAYRTTICFYIQTDNLDILNIDKDSNSRLVKYCNRIMIKDIGFDVTEIEISPEIDQSQTRRYSGAIQKQAAESYDNSQPISNQIIINGNVYGSNIINGNENKAGNSPKESET